MAEGDGEEVEVVEAEEGVGTMADEAAVVVVVIKDEEDMVVEEEDPTVTGN